MAEQQQDQQQGGSSQAMVVKVIAAGLHTQPNNLKTPPGALLEAKNVVIDRDNIIQVRRGVDRYGQQLQMASDERPNTFFSYKDRLILSYGDRLAYDSDGAGTWVNYDGSYTPPSGAFIMHAASSNKNLYFTTDAGIKKLESLTGTVKKAGMAPGLDGSGTTTGSSGFFTTSKQVAYRVVWGIIDANKNLLLGTPGQRIIVANSSGGDRNVQLTFSVPEGITTSHFYRVYRSPLSASITTEPSDNLYQVLQANPTSAEITSAVITITDNVPDDIRSQAEQLYTNEGQEGILQSNDEPPLATDICQFRNYMFFANTESKQTFDMSLVTVGGSGLVDGDTLTANGIAYTGGPAESTVSGIFQIFTAGTVAENIDDTANSFVRVVNRYPNNDSIYAYNVSGFNQIGNIRLQERSIGDTNGPFTVQSSRPYAWTPDLTSPVESDNDSTPNYVRYSKLQQPDAVPQSIGQNFLPVGSADFPIKRMIALNQGIFVYKDDGYFRISGTSPDNFQVDVIDPTMQLVAQKSAVPITNTVMADTELSVVRMEDGGGTNIIGRPVQFDLLKLATYAGFEDNTFSIPYESDAKLIMFTVKEASDTTPQQAYTYNYITDAWTTWEFRHPMTAGIVNPADDHLYLAAAPETTIAVSGYVYRERKAFTADDYVDDSFDVAISSVGDTNIALGPAPSGLTAAPGLATGWWLVQDGIGSDITDITASGVVVSDSDLEWSIGAANLYAPIDVSVKYAPEHCGNPDMVKHFQELIVSFREANFNELTFTLENDNGASPTNVVARARGVGGWGNFGWGSLPWGANIGVDNAQDIRKLIPRNQRRGHWIILSTNFSQPLRNFDIQGVGYVYTPVSTRYYGAA